MRFWDRKHRELMRRDRAGHIIFKRHISRTLTTEGRWAVAVVAGGVLYVAWLAI